MFLFAVIVFPHIKMLSSFGEKKAGENPTAEAQNLRGFFLCLFFDVGTCEALILIPLIRKHLASSPQTNRKDAILHSNPIKPTP